MAIQIKFLLLLMLLIAIPIASADPPVTSVQQFTEGYIIEHSPQDYLKQNQDYTLNFFVRNISNGVIVTNTTVNCTFYMANSSGDLLLMQNVTYSSGYWNLLIKGGNFSTSGIYSYGIACNGALRGGEKVSAWEVNSIGYGLTESNSILNTTLIAILVFIFIITFIGIGMLPASNIKDEEGKLLSISYLKYLRNILWFFEWFMLIAILYISSNLAFAYLGTQLLAKFFFALFTIAMALTPVIVIVWVIWIFVSMFHDKQLQNLLNRGMFGNTI